MGYYVPYDPASWYSLESNASSLDMVAVQWVSLDACGGLTSHDDRTLHQFARTAGLQVFPSLLTHSGELNHRLLTDEDLRAQVVDELVDYVVQEDYDGLDLDLEGVLASDRAAYTNFVARLTAALHAHQKQLTLALPAKTTDTTSGWSGAYDYAALGRLADLVTIMAYAYHGSWGEPGAIAPYDWVAQVAAFATAQIPPEKVLLGLAFYGYDWNTTAGGARSLGAPQAALLSAQYGVPLELDPATRSETFRYRTPTGETPSFPSAPPFPSHEIVHRAAPDCPVPSAPPPTTPTPRPLPAPDAMQDHEVWLEGSASVAARLSLVDSYGAAGVATWRLGHEDAGMWEVMGRWRQGER